MRPTSGIEFENHEQLGLGPTVVPVHGFEPGTPVFLSFSLISPSYFS